LSLIMVSFLVSPQANRKLGIIKINNNNLKFYLTLQQSIFVVKPTDK